MTDWIGIFCHQLPGRSPHQDGMIFPLCYRCAGIYFGLFAAYFWIGCDGRGWRRRLPGINATLILCGGIAPLLVDGWANALNLWETPGWLRAVTGIGVGTALPRFLLPLLQSTDRATDPELPSTVAGRWSLVGPLTISACLVSLLVWSSSPTVFHSLIAVTGIGMVTLCANLVGMIGRTVLEWIDRKRAGNSPARRPA